MTSAAEELKEVTKLVLYGWGYPALFRTSEGELLQNRMVRFPLDAAPAIEGANKAAFRPIRGKLELVKANYLDTITHHSGVNPFWVWVDTPNLSEEEIVDYQQQFMVWANQRGLTDAAVNRVAPDWSQFVLPSIHTLTTQALKAASYWKQTVLAIGLILALLVAHLLAVPAVACPAEGINIGTEECVEAIGLSSELINPGMSHTDVPDLLETSSSSLVNTN